MPPLSEAAKTLSEYPSPAGKLSTAEDADDSQNVWPEPEPEPDPVYNVVPIGGSTQTIPDKILPGSTSELGIDKSSTEDPAPDPIPEPTPAPEPILETPQATEPIPAPPPVIEPTKAKNESEVKDEQLPAPDPTHEQFDRVNDVAQPSDDNTSTIALSVLGILGVFGGLYVATKKGWL